MGSGAPSDCVQDHQRDELFRKLAGAVVVRAVGDDRGQAVGRVVGADQVVRARLGRGVRRVRRVRRVLREHARRRRGCRTPRPWTRAGSGSGPGRPRAGWPRRRARPRAARRSPELVSTKRTGIVDRAVHVRLRGQVDHGGGGVPRSMASIAARSATSPRTKVNRGSSSTPSRFGEVARVGELVRRPPGAAGRERAKRTKFEPMNPAPPVTTMVPSICRRPV